MKRTRLTDLQRELVRRLEAGEHITGPVTVRSGSHGAAFGSVTLPARAGNFGPYATWIPDGNAVRSLAARGVVRVDVDPTTWRKTVRLAEDPAQ